ncbi:hypothetical protein K9F62_00225 [Desulfovibrio sp. JY]|nr:hypothetical protein K9F62_00225 [Desulfovibrio sp. JY]
MSKTEGIWNALSSFFIKHSTTIFVIATIICLVLITYLTNHLRPYVVGAWVVVGILTSLLFSGVALVVVLAVAAVQKARHLRLITYEPNGANTLRASFENEKIRLGEFYSPYLVPNEGKTFTHCEIEGPGGLLFRGTSRLERCRFTLCDVIVVNEGDKVNTAAHFVDGTFTDCHFVNVALYLTQETAAALFKSHKDATGEEMVMFCFRQG